MVIARSAGWVRPAQARVHSESGEVKYFPPRTGGLPRALTFLEQEWIQSSDQHRMSTRDEPQMLSTFEYSEHVPRQDSYLVTSQSENFHIEDPPEEYMSFENDYSRHSIAIARDLYSYSDIDLEVPSMSTPTEQYLTNVLQRRPVSPQSALPTNQQQFVSSASDTQNGCISPLLQPESGPSLSLNDLVDLYSKKLEVAREAKLSKVVSRDVENTGEDLNEQNLHLDETKDARLDAADRMDNEDDDSNLANVSSNPKSQNRSGVVSMCHPMQLMAVDVQRFIEKLDDMCTDDRNYLEHEDCFYVSTEELESLLMSCCKERVDFVMMNSHDHDRSKNLL